MMHTFEVVSWGPPAFTARCSCRDWYLAWDADDLRQRGSDNIATVERAARAEHEAHARARVDLDARAARAADFY